MAVEQKDFGKVRIWVDGAFMVYVSSITKRTDAGNIPVNVLNEGLAGFTNGSGSVNISVGYFFPASGPEVNFDDLCVERGYHDVQVAVSGTSGVMRGKFSDNEVSQSTDQATSGTVNFIGEFKALK